MKKIFKNPFLILKWGVVVLSVANLIFLFVFHYRIPGFLRFWESDPIDATATVIDADAAGEDTAPDTALQIQVPEEPLYYDSSQALDLTDGVTLVDETGAKRTDIRLFSVIKAGSSQKEKIIEYSATDESGTRITAQRALVLDDSYTGPFIEITGEMPALSADDLPVLVSLLNTKGQIHAEDGFGNDVTGAVTATVKTPADESGNTVVTLAITNMVDDFYSVDVTVFTGSVSGPRMKLTMNSVTLQEGESFNFYNYIDSATDDEGNDLHHRITVEGSVDTDTPGTYSVEFYCMDEDGNRSNVETLTVTVQ